MSEIIASTYELIGRLGSGGGGTVYLANHLRLGKKVVLKADKRKITTRPELLRREVDVLKELSHSYIPQVYDFFVENETVFTVMDYIDGESLDKYLKQGFKFSQPQVIKWACQILKALSYLHSPTHGDPPKGYVHSDIKPANIMLRPNGDICLIDFNISLAIGEENVVGGSPGYASPEHYGQDYSFSGSSGDTVTMDNPSAAEDGTTVTMSMPQGATGSSSIKKLIVPDARSDIYSLGATLYHLLSGHRPSKDAKQVEPLSKSEFSPPLVDIITKAMNPNPDLRFQSADEMLQAIYDLWNKDPRVIRQKHKLVVGTVILSAMLIIGSLTVFAGLRQMERLQTAQVLSANSAEALSRGDVQSAIDNALEALVDDPGAFDIPYTANAQLALTNALGVYDLSDSFKPYLMLDLPSAPFRILKTPDETKLLVTYAYKLAIYDIQSGEVIKTLPTLDSAICEVEFLSDSIILYAGSDGLTAYDISGDKTLWTADPATAIAVSGDKKIVAAIYKTDSKIRFYSTSTGVLISFRDLQTKHLNLPENDKFADAMRDVFELNDDGSLCAVSLTGGHLSVLDIYNKFNDLYIYETSDYTVFDGEFCGDIFAYSAYGTRSVFSMVDVRKDISLGNIEGNVPFTVSKYGDEIYISSNDTVVKIDPSDFKQTAVAYTENKNITSFDISKKHVISSTDEGFAVFGIDAGLIQSETRETAPDFVLAAENYIILANRNSEVIEILKLKDYGEAKLLDYDPRIEHSEARISKDGSVMLFSIKSFTVLNPDGSERLTYQIPESEKIYDQQYRHDGDYLDVIYYSGKVISYSAKDGKIISEAEISPPDDSLDEQFETENYIIKSPLHGVPEVISKATGRKIAELRADDYLTYITEAEGYIIAQYVQTDGNIYGVLMNAGCEELAILPRLCDIADGELIFDFPGGNIKRSELYSLKELKEKARDYRN